MADVSTLRVRSCSTCLVSQLVAFHSGRTSVFGRQTFPLLRLTCSWRVTSYMGKSSAAGQPTRPTWPFTLSVSINSKLQSDVRSGGAIWRMLTGWRPAVVIGAVVCYSCCCGSNCSLARSIDGRISTAAPFALADQLPLQIRSDQIRFICDKGPLATDTSRTQYITQKLNEVHRMIVTRGWSGFPVYIRRATYQSLALAFWLLSVVCVNVYYIKEHKITF